VNTAALKRGAVGGLAGGIVMAMWSMIVMGMAGTGFWTPLNLIAPHLLALGALGGAFSWPGLLIGMVVHLAMSIALGMALAVPVTAIGGWATTPADAALAGMAFGLIVWLVMQYLLWDAIDPAAAERFTP
jgi:hypothetical protein